MCLSGEDSSIFPCAERLFGASLFSALLAPRHVTRKTGGWFIPTHFLLMLYYEHLRSEGRKNLKYRLCAIFLIVGLTGTCLGNGLQTSAWASPGTDVFQGFIQHIAAQIEKDKREFSIADTCTAWFYKHMNQKPPRPEVERIHFFPLGQTDPDFDCANLFPEGLEQVRQAFGQTQQLLSLSLTFYQMALVGDGDDNQEYSSEEIRDVLESFGLPFYEGQPLRRYMGDLTGLFETIRREVQFKFLMEGMQALMNKGYRFTSADQTALNQELQ